MMQLFKGNSSKQKEIAAEVNKKLTEALNKEFKEKHEEMKQTLLSNGAKLEEVDNILEEIKRETQVKMLEEYKKNLRRLVLNRNNPQQAPHAQPAESNTAPQLKGPS